ncbi:hypothetical protein B7R54_14200 [Subtercola boreus]|uniref:Uncharacterized protein n=1 Tax=Subtercola boreus TaxID=120213 RepID=A0A3E0VLC7_9MICO|nr:hypothetical protein [Subtercola boreus]RFA10230.1 hypothetical protein B7R54_14200 [Subtercola boreus]TQL52594.1 hypothetical protein FB464_0077 [Subtercola boreus]
MRAVTAAHLHGRRVTRLVAAVAGLAAFALVALVSLAPPPQAPTADGAHGYVQTSAQGSLQIVTVPGDAAGVTVTRDDYSATAGVKTLAAGSTNKDWATLVLLLAGFPMTDSNITVMMRWMRQENGPPDWWNRNNPLNNGWGSGGGSGFGSYDNLSTAAANCAEALHSVSGYSAIVAGFQASAPTAQIESAIWASPWASSHYANGSHWSYAPVPVIASPAGTW